MVCTLRMSSEVLMRCLDGLLVFSVDAYWCCDRRQRERKALLMSRLVEPIEEEHGRCRTEVILDEAETQPQRSRRMRQQLRQLYKLIDEDFIARLPEADRLHLSGLFCLSLIHISEPTRPY